MLWLLPASITAMHVLSNETDRLALLKFKQAIESDPQSVLSSWNDSVNMCNWVGITCSLRHQRVTALDLPQRNLRGFISPYIANLTFLRYVTLSNNSFFGEIPPDIGRLFRLRVLSFSNNTLGGVIPVSLVMNCSSLEIIDISRNKLTGKLPKEIGFLVKLVRIYAGINNLTGDIPPTIGNLSSLETFWVPFNNLAGHIPDDVRRLKRLLCFNIGVNGLSGTIPTSLYNISSIREIVMADNNQLRGTLPGNIGITLPNLEALGLSDNEFSGSIPASLCNASKLQIISIDVNNFVGQVPTNFGNLQELRWLDISHNNLGSNSSNDLDFLRSLRNCSKLKILDFNHNHLGGVLPNSIANLSTQLNSLVLGSNQVSGKIDGAIFENLINLVQLSMENNLFTGIIPTSFGKFLNMQWISINRNKLSGHIPSSLGNLTKLALLSLEMNNLEGTIPPSLGNCQRLQYLDISQNKLYGAIPHQVLGLSSLSRVLNLSKNSLNGTLPAEVGYLKNLYAMDLSENSLSGEIPPTIGKCQILEYLYLQGNSFQGILPSSFVSLKSLQKLDLSRNKLSGQIPKDLEKIPTFLYLNLSYNNLEGEVPKSGAFGNASAISLTGNAKLCGGVSTLKLPTCPIKLSKQGKKNNFKTIIAIVSVAISFLVLATFVVVYWRRKSTYKSTSVLHILESLPKVSYRRLYEATEGFSPSNLIGSGGFGSVYKGVLERQSVAVKVLNLHQIGASKTFITECNALRNIRHQNLVKNLTCCSSTDYNQNEFKALVFEFMTNGSLEKWLHPDTVNEKQSRNLSLIERLNVAIDVASALHYLHDQCETTIIHCDIKPSNVLLDNYMVAHLGDFGLARLVLTTNNYSQTQSSTIGMMGTIGYVCPEYGMGGPASKQGDVYSYGILLLEMFTGKRASGDIFVEGLNLHTFVANALPERLLQIVDPNVIPSASMTTEEETHNNTGGISTEKVSQMNGNYVESCLLSVLKIGVGCSMESPGDRLKMEAVTRELHYIRKAFLVELQSDAEVGLHPTSESAAPSDPSTDPSKKTRNNAKTEPQLAMCDGTVGFLSARPHPQKVGYHLKTLQSSSKNSVMSLDKSLGWLLGHVIEKSLS
ncbi:hypothetical protein FNV43_RR05774 [Rhamnella rubrinervis]|uniref:non-specific serine/threonine protein kinase n=1 Tax=Rhamnella rubrinervis TaxID=2594499 RepID=A0A8K0HLX5_9ROSA|nr:hypothetical protein FNV43_RR05774 [Rhamnella rubrinervis]